MAPGACQSLDLILQASWGIRGTLSSQLQWEYGHYTSLMYSLQACDKNDRCCKCQMNVTYKMIIFNTSLQTKISNIIIKHYMFSFLWHFIYIIYSMILISDPNLYSQQRQNNLQSQACYCMETLSALHPLWEDQLCGTSMCALLLA